MRTISNDDMFIKNVGVYRFKKFLKYFFTYLLLALQGLIVLLPFYIMILTSLKSRESFMVGSATMNFEWWVPIKEAIQNASVNYKYAYEAIRFGKVMLNTVVVAILGTIGTVITTVLASYAFARLNFKGKELLFTLFIATMMIPGEIFIITNLTTMVNVGLIGQGWFETILAETLPFLTSIYYIYYLRQTFMSVPNELYYAAKVDGTSDFKYLLKVMVPISSGTIISITILNAMSSWNAYVWPNLVSRERDFYLVTQALRNANWNIEQSGMMDYGGQMAAAFMVTLPLLIIFFALKKYIMRGVSRSGIKG